MDDQELVAAAAANFAAWHESSVRALGWQGRTGDGWWTCRMPAPNIYHSAVSLRPTTSRRQRATMFEQLQAHLDDPESGYVSVCDAWDDLDLRRLGLTRRATAPWCARPAGPVAASTRGPSGLRIEVVTEPSVLADFELTVVRGFGARLPIAKFDIHGPGILDDPAMHLFLGRDDNDAEPVAVSMAMVTGAVVGIYGVATVESARGRGYATEMTNAAIGVATDRPAVLQPSPAAASMYGRLGFVQVGRFSHWT